MVDELIISGDCGATAVIPHNIYSYHMDTEFWTVCKKQSAYLIKPSHHTLYPACRSDKRFPGPIKVISPADCNSRQRRRVRWFDVKMASAMRKFSIVSDVISLLISVVDIKYDHSFS